MSVFVYVWDTADTVKGDRNGKQITIRFRDKINTKNLTVPFRFPPEKETAE